jgi:hypothetical protein
MKKFKFFNKININVEYGETEEFELYNVGPMIFEPRTFVPHRRTYYRHRIGGEIIEGQLVGANDVLFIYPQDYQPI